MTSHRARKTIREWLQSFAGGIARMMNALALGGIDLLLLALVAGLVWTWVVVRGHRAYEGLLGRPLRVGIVSWPGYAGGLVANKGLRRSKDSDFWRRQLLVEFVLDEDENDLRRDFIRGGDKGGVDVIWSTVDALAQQAPELREEGLDPRAFMQVDCSHGADAFVARPGIERIEQLLGKTVVVSPAASQWLFEYSLESSSLDPREIPSIRLGRERTSSSEQAKTLFLKGRADAAVLWEPDVREALKLHGAKVLVDTRAANQLIADVMVANETFIQQHPDVIAAFIAGWLWDGTRKVVDDPMQAVEALRVEPKFAGLTDEDALHLLTEAPVATFDDNVEMFGLEENHPFFTDLFKQVSRVYRKAGYITREVSADSARDSNILDQVYRSTRPEVDVTDCQEFKTDTLAVPFYPKKAELTLEARRVLGDEIMTFLLSSHAAVRFCIEVSGGSGNDDNAERRLRQQREEAVIEFLEKSCNRPRSQFVATDGDVHEAVGGDRIHRRYIRLKLISGSD